MDTEQVVEISCDNPNCPGNHDLDPNSRTGWLFITSEVYGEPTQQSVFGSIGCLNAATHGQPELFTGSPPEEPA
jgi:hypothetical protein